MTKLNSINENISAGRKIGVRFGLTFLTNLKKEVIPKAIIKAKRGAPMIER